MNNKTSYNNSGGTGRPQQVNQFPRQLQDISRQMTNYHHRRLQMVSEGAMGINLITLQRDRSERPSTMELIESALRVVHGDGNFLLPGTSTTGTNASIIKTAHERTQ